MHAPFVSLIFGLVATAVATPRHHYNHGHHESGHHESGHHASGHVGSGHASISGMPYPLGNGTNATAIAASFHLQHTFYLTSTSTVIAPSPKLTNAPPAPQDSGVGSPTLANAQPTPSNAGVEDKVLADQASGASDACNVVTVTYNPTVTVTVTSSLNEATPTPVGPPANLGSSASVSSVSSALPSAEAALTSSTLPVEPPASSQAEQAPSSSAASPEVPVSSSAAAASNAATTAAPIPASSAQSEAASLQSSSSPPTPSQSTTTSANTSGVRTKRGILASGPDQKLLISGLTPYNKISWAGDWYSGPPTNLPSTMQFVPQNYGKQSDVKGEWTSNAKQAVAAGDKYFLSFGEPGTPNAQLYMDPQDAVTLFMAKMQPYADEGVSIGAPGTLQNDQDFAWLSSFLDLCDKAGCKIGFLAMHWFWTAENAQSFKDTAGKFVALAKGKPLWVDNFQATGSVDAQKAFLQEVVPWLDQQDSIARYAYVPVDRGNGEGFLNDGDGKLSELGQFYATL